MSTTASSSAQLRVASARDLGPQFVENAHCMVGQDGAFSIPLDERETLWFFGDTLVGTRPRDHSIWLIDNQLVGPRDMSGRGTFDQMINNTGLILPNQDSRKGLREYRYLLNDRGKLKNLIQLEGDEHPDRDRIWCQHGICIGETAYLSFIAVRMLEKNTTPLPLGFEIVGSGLAVGSTRDWTFTRARCKDGDSILWKADEPHFATAFLRHEADFVYLFGTVNRDAKQRCYLARVAPDDLPNLDRYEYLISTTPRWGKHVSDAVEIFTGMPSELSVSFNSHLGCYLAVHSLDLSGDIVARTALHPWGPWSNPILLWKVSVPALPYERPYAFPLIYAGKEHPTLSRENGRAIYLTYIEFEEYFPHLVEVTFE